MPKKIMWYGAQIAEAIHDYIQTMDLLEQTRSDFAILRKIMKPILTVLAIPMVAVSKRNGVERITCFVDAHTVEVTIVAKYYRNCGPVPTLIPSVPGAEFKET